MRPYPEGLGHWLGWAAASPVDPERAGAGLPRRRPPGRHVVGRGVRRTHSIAHGKPRAVPPAPPGAAPFASFDVAPDEERWIFLRPAESSLSGGPRRAPAGGPPGARLVQRGSGRWAAVGDEKSPRRGARDTARGEERELEGDWRGSIPGFGGPTSSEPAASSTTVDSGVRIPVRARRGERRAGSFAPCGSCSPAPPLSGSAVAPPARRGDSHELRALVRATSDTGLLDSLGAATFVGDVTEPVLHARGHVRLRPHGARAAAEVRSTSKGART